MSLPANGDPHGPASLPGSRMTLSFFCLLHTPGYPQEPSRQSSPFLYPGQCLACHLQWAGLQAGVGFRPLGRWGGCGPRPRLPAHLPPSRAQPLPSRASLWTQDQHFPSLGRRPSPSQSDSLFPWPTATPVSWQEAGARLCRSHGVWYERATRPLGQEEGLRAAGQAAHGGWPGDSKASGWDLQWPGGTSTSPSPLAFSLVFLLPTMKKEVT